MKLDDFSPAGLAGFDTILDVRSPAEYAEDHLPGAESAPVLSNEQRARVGTLYTQDPFAAMKLGGALIARSIADHLEQRFLDRPKSWRPLIYCWRGGQRSGAMHTVFRQVGWKSEQLEGGYKRYRHWVLAQLDAQPARYRYRVLTGPTGSGKSRLLTAIREAGGQVLDLEALAAHRGSVLGALPDAVQPAQKGFDSRLVGALAALSPEQPVFVEAESRKIGRITLPPALLTALWDSPCVRVQAPLATRVRYLCEEYRHYLTDPAQLDADLGRLVPLHGRDTVNDWLALAREGQHAALVETLLRSHYDPLYARSSDSHYRLAGEAPALMLADVSQDALAGAAEALLRLA